MSRLTSFYEHSESESERTLSLTHCSCTPLVPFPPSLCTEHLEVHAIDSLMWLILCKVSDFFIVEALYVRHFQSTTTRMVCHTIAARAIPCRIDAWYVENADLARRTRNDCDQGQHPR